MTWNQTHGRRWPKLASLAEFTSYRRVDAYIRAEMLATPLPATDTM